MRRILCHLIMTAGVLNAGALQVELTGRRPAFYKMAVPALRSPAAPGYGDICFSPRRLSWGGRDPVEVAQGFHATRIDWVYIDRGDLPILQRFSDAGISIGVAISQFMWDTDSDREGAVGFAAHPEYYTLGRVLDIQGHVLDGSGSMHDPAYKDVVKTWLRLAAEAGAERIQRDDPAWSYSSWDFNPYALSQFRDYLSALPSETLQPLGIQNPSGFDLADYILNQPPTNAVPPGFRSIWEAFRLETLLDWYDEQRQWTADLIGTNAEWSANYSSFIQFNSAQTWSDYIMTELQPSGGQFGIGNPWSLYSKLQTARSLGKGMVVTLGSQNIYENKVMIALTYALGCHMLCPYAVYMKDVPRDYPDPALYEDIYGFVSQWAETYFDGYEEAYALGNGIPDGSNGRPPLTLDDFSGKTYAFVRARPGEPDAPVVIHLVNFGLSPVSGDVTLTLDPDRCFPGRDMQITLLRPGAEPQILATNGISQVVLPQPQPWHLIVLEPLPEEPVWSPHLLAESQNFFQTNRVELSSFTPGTQIRYTLNGDTPTVTSPIYAGPLNITESLTLKAIAFSGEQGSPVSVFALSKIASNALTNPPTGLTAGLHYELYTGILEGEDSDNPMTWEGGSYLYTLHSAGTLGGIQIPSGAPPSRFFVTFSGLIDIPADGVYRFYARADDECRLSIDGSEIIRLSGRKRPTEGLGAVEISGKALLARGLHTMDVNYVQMYDNKELGVEWEGPALSRQILGGRFLQHEE